MKPHSLHTVFTFPCRSGIHRGVAESPHDHRSAPPCSFRAATDTAAAPTRAEQEKNYQFARRELERVQQARMEEELRVERERYAINIWLFMLLLQFPFYDCGSR